MVPSLDRGPGDAGAVGRASPVHWFFPMRHRLLLIFCCLAAAFGSPQALAQQASPEEATRAPAAPALTLERLEALWASAGASLSPEAIEALRPEYERAKALLEETRANEAETARLDQERAEAASLLESIRVELAQPAPERALDLPEQPTVEQVQQALSAAQADLSAAQQRVRDLEAEQTRRSARREALPGEIAATRRLLEEHSEQSPVAVEEQPSESGCHACNKPNKDGNTGGVNAAHGRQHFIIGKAAHHAAIARVVQEVVQGTRNHHNQPQREHLVAGEACAQEGEVLREG